MQYVVGQNHFAKKVLARSQSITITNVCAIANTSKINSDEDNDDSIELGKSNILLIGPTGCRKNVACAENAWRKDY